MLMIARTFLQPFPLRPFTRLCGSTYLEADGQGDTVAYSTKEVLEHRNAYL